MQLSEAKRTLHDRKGNLRCREVISILEQLGFEVRGGKRGGHKIFVHHALPDFLSGSINCGHGKNPEIKPAYITNILQILEQHTIALSEFLNEGKDHD